MPLIHSKKPEAFKKNIETEVEHGKPVKQAVAIAYSEAEHAKHKADGGMVKDCKMCMGGQTAANEKEPIKLAEGGEVSEHEDKKEDESMVDDEIHDMMGEELMSAIDAKDKKRIMESIENMVMSCMNKRMG